MWNRHKYLIYYRLVSKFITEKTKLNKRSWNLKTKFKKKNLNLVQVQSFLLKFEN